MPNYSGPEFFGFKWMQLPLKSRKNYSVLLAKCTFVEHCLALCWGCFWASVRMRHSKADMRNGTFLFFKVILYLQHLILLLTTDLCLLASLWEFKFFLNPLKSGLAKLQDFHFINIFAFISCWHDIETFSTFSWKKVTYSDQAITQHLECSQGMKLWV